MDKETLKYVLASNATRMLPKTAPRTLRLPLDSGKIVTLVGIRRSGKTYLLYDTMQRLESQGVDRRQIVYLNFEDDRLLPIKTRELDLVLRAHEELYPDMTGKKKYLFLDEVQNVPRWETFVRRLHDTENMSIFVTGSSSQLLTRELATGLRGRSLSYEVFPLSFAEYLSFTGREHQRYSRPSDSRTAAALLDYLTVGGLPEVVLADPILRPRILQEYVTLVFYKDLVERYGVSNPTVLRQLLKRCLGQPASTISTHKLYNEFRSLGIELSKDTLYRYIDHLEESYLIFALAVSDRSLRRQAMNPKKRHPVDWALGYPFVTEDSIDIGHKLETAVFLHWRRRRQDLAYMGGQHEIDLVVGGDHPAILVNVAYSVTQSATWDREMASLTWGAGQAPQAKRILVVHEGANRKPPQGIEVIDAWRYLLTPPADGMSPLALNN